MKFGTVMHFGTQLLMYSSNLLFSTILYGNLMWLKSTRHAGLCRPALSAAHFYFFCCKSYVKLLDYWRVEIFSLLPEAP